MMLATGAIALGLVLLVWSADRFVDGAAATAQHFGMPQLLIGMVVIGFGTSFPEMIVSVLAASQGNPGIALGNAYGSNITNIALILGVTAMIHPIAVHAQVIRKELPVLILVTVLAVWQLWDSQISRWDAIVLLAVFLGLMTWTIMRSMRASKALDAQTKEESPEIPAMPLQSGVMWLVIGLVVLIGSSRLLVWGAVELAQRFGVSDLLIGLTIVAIGTSLPELASAVIAARKGQHDLAIGNILGSNLFNTLAVVGLAGVIQPITVARVVLYRDMLVMGGLTLLLFAFCYHYRKPAQLGRAKGAFLVLCYVAYTSLLIKTVLDTYA